MAGKDKAAAKASDLDIEFVPDVAHVPEPESKAQQPDEDKMVRSAEDKVAKAGRFDWEPIGAESKQAQHGHWRVRVQQLGATGLWRPFVEYIGDDYKTEDGAEKALERLLR